MCEACAAGGWRAPNWGLAGWGPARRDWTGLHRLHGAGPAPTAPSGPAAPAGPPQAVRLAHERYPVPRHPLHHEASCRAPREMPFRVARGGARSTSTVEVLHPGGDRLVPRASCRAPSGVGEHGHVAGPRVARRRGRVARLELAPAVPARPKEGRCPWQGWRNLDDRRVMELLSTGDGSLIIDWLSTGDRRLIDGFTGGAIDG